MEIQLNEYDIKKLGWNEYFEANFNSLRCEKDMMAARIIAEHRETYKILCEAGELSAEITGKMRFAAKCRVDFPAVGDFVAVSARPDEKSASIHAVIPRKTAICRKATGDYSYEQIVAANVDIVFIVTSLNGEYKPRRLERYLTLVYESGAKPVIILTKADLCEDYEAMAEQTRAACIGVDTIVASSITGLGFENIEAALKPGITAVFAGSSGVGKSSVLNRLMGRDIQKINEIREDDARGRHTTTHRELFLLESGALLIDTPGMRELQMSDDLNGLEEAFNDIESLAQNCRYRDCRHDAEPGCAVASAIERGELDYKRFQNYKNLRREIEHYAAQSDARLRRAEEKKWKQIAKAMKNYSKENRYKI